MKSAIEKTNKSIHIINEEMLIIMINKSFIPWGKLTPYVVIFCYSDGYTPPTGKERVLPSGSAQLIINLGDDCFRYFIGCYSNNYQQITNYHYHE